MNEQDINNFTPDDFIMKKDVIKIVNDVKKEKETEQLKRIANAIEEILRLVRKDMGEMKKAAK